MCVGKLGNGGEGRREKIEGGEKEEKEEKGEREKREKKDTAITRQNIPVKSNVIRKCVPGSHAQLSQSYSYLNKRVLRKEVKINKQFRKYLVTKKHTLMIVQVRASIIREQ
jgi:hypothetical protein